MDQLSPIAVLFAFFCCHGSCCGARYSSFHGISWNKEN